MRNIIIHGFFLDNQQQPTTLFANLKNVYKEQNKFKYIRQKNYSEKQKTKRAELPSSSKQRRRRTPVTF